MTDKAGIAIEAAGVSVTNKATAAGALTGAVGWAASLDWVGLLGAFIAIVGLSANIYFQVRRDRREAKESAARIAAFQGFGEQCDKSCDKQDICLSRSDALNKINKRI